MLTSPPDGAVEISPTTVKLEWNPVVGEWGGVNGMSCDDDSCPDCYENDYDLDNRYEIFLTTNPSNVPPAGACPGCATSTTTSWTIGPGKPYYPLLPGTVYYWSVRAVNPGGGGDVDCPQYGCWTTRSFTTDYPPTVDNIQVVPNEKLKCMLPAGGVSRWTGDVTYPNVNNPIDIEVTVSDPDGWDDVDTVWLEIAKNNDSGFDMNVPFACYNELADYADISLNVGYLASGYKNAIKIEAPEGFCSPNCGYTTQGACDAAVGCSWDAGSYFKNPTECMCKRNWTEKAFVPPVSPETLFQFDSSCEWPSAPGTYTECHGCYFQTDHPNYTILGVNQTVKSGTQVSYTFTIQFKNTYPPGLQQFYGMARSWPLFSGKSSCGSDYDSCRKTDPSWTWGFDFNKPLGTISVIHEPGDPSNQVDVTDDISDPLESGIRRVYDREYSVTRDGTEVLSGTIPIPGEESPGSKFYSGQTSLTIGPTALSLVGIQGGDVVNVSDVREDMACNLQNTADDHSPGSDIEIGHQWITTFGSDVYGFGGFHDPIELVGSALSQYWLGGKESDSPCSSSPFEPGVGSLLGWCSPTYTDNNRIGFRGRGWYDELYRLALNSSWIEDVQTGGIIPIDSDEVTAVIANSDPASEGIYEVQSGTATINSGTVCNGRKIFFFASGAGLVIEPDLTVANTSSACLFIIADQEIQINPGGDGTNPAQEPYGSGDPDIIQAAFITDLMFDVEADTSGDRYDSLRIEGFVFSDHANFGRDLLWEDNWLYPAELIDYDPRYLALLKDMLGRRPFSDLECGIVKGTGSCEDWISL